MFNYYVKYPKKSAFKVTYDDYRSLLFDAFRKSLSCIERVHRFGKTLVFYSNKH